MVNVSTKASIYEKVDSASEQVLKGKRRHMAYLRGRPLGEADEPPPDGYRFEPREIHGVAQDILNLTKDSVPHRPINLSSSYPPKGIDLVTDMNADLEKRIRKVMV